MSNSNFYIKCSSGEEKSGKIYTTWFNFILFISHDSKKNYQGTKDGNDIQRKRKQVKDEKIHLILKLRNMQIWEKSKNYKIRSCQKAWFFIFKKQSNFEHVYEEFFRLVVLFGID